MKKPIIQNILLTFAVITVLLLSTTPTAHDFTSLKHHLGERADSITLIEKVHEKHWDIAYKYGPDCPADYKAKNKEIEDLITKALQLWLQPLREIETKEPIVNQFRYHNNDNNEITLEIWVNILELSVLNTCLVDRSGVGFDHRFPPRIIMRKGTDLGDQFFSTLVHEIGHAFGLGDTYIDALRYLDLGISTGGLPQLVGTQPASVMGMHFYRHGLSWQSEDDTNGIIWLYKATYENLDVKDCFFTDYMFEEVEDTPVLGCVPKYPLIFEIRQGHEYFANLILNEDPNIDVNAQNAIGFSALHYAVTGTHLDFLNRLLNHRDIDVNLKDERGKTPLHYAIGEYNGAVVEALLTHKDILVHLADNAGRTPVAVARENGHTRLATRLITHPNYALSVAPHRKLATTWASLKKPRL